jgi:hypothetical protein
MTARLVILSLLVPIIAGAQPQPPLPPRFGPWDNDLILARSTDGITFSLIATVSPSTTTYTDTALSPNTTYSYYLVNLLNTDGTSPASLTITAVTLPLLTP